MVVFLFFLNTYIAVIQNDTLGCSHSLVSVVLIIEGGGGGGINHHPLSK